MRRLTAGLLAALVMMATVPTIASAATRPITFFAFIGDECIQGNASDGAIVHVVWRDADGTLKANKTLTADGSNDGYFSACGSGPDVVVEKGDRLRANDGTSTHSLVVPELTAQGNRVRDVYKGRGPAGQYVKLICAFSNGFEPCMQTWKIRVNAEGQWSFKPGWDVGAGETMLLQWKSAVGDAIITIATPAILTVRIGSAHLVGVTRDGAPAAIVLRRGPSFDIRATTNVASSPVDGEFTGKLRNQAGNKVNVRAGDLISSDIAPDLEWIVPDIQASGDSSTGHVTGRCVYDDPSGPLNGDLRIDAPGDSSEITDNMEEDGSFDVELDFAAGDKLIVGCGMSTGDWVEKVFTAV